MNRYAIENLFGIEGLNVAWYGIIITCGMVLGFALAIYRCRKTGINKEHIYNLALWLIPVCIICARALCLGKLSDVGGILSIKRHMETKLQILRSAFSLTAFP